MPYPYTNELGNQPPKTFNKQVAYYNASSKSLKAEADALNALANDPAVKAKVQKEMMDKLFGANPSTLKFPSVKPGYTPVDKGTKGLGFADKLSTPDAPEKFYDFQEAMKSKVLGSFENAAKQAPLINKDQLLENLKSIYKDNKGDLYKSLYGGSEYKQNVLKEVYEQTPAPKTHPFQGFTKPATTLGDENSFEVLMQFKIEGLENCDGKVMYAKQLVAKQYIYGQGQLAKLKIVEDMLRQIRDEIIKNMKGGKS